MVRSLFGGVAWCRGDETHGHSNYSRYDLTGCGVNERYRNRTSELRAGPQAHRKGMRVMS
ncbi:MAG: hypothetical protein ACFB0C_05215 [Leptolyngbyaceae cyanobacterium]